MNLGQKSLVVISLTTLVILTITAYGMGQRIKQQFVQKTEYQDTQSYLDSMLAHKNRFEYDLTTTPANDRDQ